MPITYFTENVSLPKQFKKQPVNQWIKDTIRSYGKKTGNIAYIFCDDEKIIELNRQYLHHDYYTDIITFDYTEGDKLSGDLYVGLDTVQRNAKIFNAKFLEELCRVMIHGILHLCGVKDKTEQERRNMTSEENQALEILQKKFEF